MAVVRMSRESVDSIIKSANGTYTKRIDAANKSFVFPYTGQQLYDLMYGSLAQHMDALPDEFFYLGSVMYIRKVGHIHLHIDSVRLGLAKPLKFSMNHPRDWDFRTINYGGGNTNSVTVELLDGHDTPHRWSSIIASAAVWKENVDKLVAQRDEFVSSVRTLVSAHTTVNSALKAWPALWELLDEDIKNRIRTPVARKKAETMDAGVDTSKLTAIVAASKML